MQNRNLRFPLAFCLGLLVHAATPLTLSAAEPPAADAAYLEQVSAELARPRAEPAPLVPDHIQPCVGGTSGGVYPCSNVDLMEFMTHTLFGTDNGESVKTNSLWGWTDPLTDHEWVLLGLNNGTAVNAATSNAN